MAKDEDDWFSNFLEAAQASARSSQGAAEKDYATKLKLFTPRFERARGSDAQEELAKRLTASTTLAGQKQFDAASDLLDGAWTLAASLLSAAAATAAAAAIEAEPITAEPVADATGDSIEPALEPAAEVTAVVASQAPIAEEPATVVEEEPALEATAPVQEPNVLAERELPAEEPAIPDLSEVAVEPTSDEPKAGFEDASVVSAAADKIPAEELAAGNSGIQSLPEEIAMQDPLPEISLAVLESETPVAEEPVAVIEAEAALPEEPNTLAELELPAEEPAIPDLSDLAAGITSEAPDAISNDAFAASTTAEEAPAAELPAVENDSIEVVPEEISAGDPLPEISLASPVAEGDDIIAEEAVLEEPAAESPENLEVGLENTFAELPAAEIQAESPRAEEPVAEITAEGVDARLEDPLPDLIAIEETPPDAPEDKEPSK